jgi:4,5-DOPA dioxygenase extradiol
MFPLLFTGHSPTLFEDGQHKAIKVALSSKAVIFNQTDMVIVISPHWVESKHLPVDVSKAPVCLQDYYGFPSRYYNFRYDPLGKPEFAEDLATSITSAGLPVESNKRGLDHGHWIPLLYLLPEGDTPIIGLGITTLDFEHHVRLGQALRIWIEKKNQEKEINIGVVISASLCHRLDLLTWGENHPFPAGEAFDQQVLEQMVSGTMTGLSYLPPELIRHAAPEGGLGPLGMLAGLAGEDRKGRVLSYEHTMTGLGLATVDFSLSR